MSYTGFCLGKKEYKNISFLYQAECKEIGLGRQIGRKSSGSVPPLDALWDNISSYMAMHTEIDF